MILLLKVQHRRLAVPAPLGAAAYAVTETNTTVTILFAMLRKGDSGLDTYNRVTHDFSAYGWLPVAARPEHQFASAFGPDDFVSYDFVLDGENNWTPANANVTAFLEAMQAVQTLPVSPPSTLAVSLSSLKPRQKAAKAA